MSDVLLDLQYLAAYSTRTLPEEVLRGERALMQHSAETLAQLLGGFARLQTVAGGEEPAFRLPPAVVQLPREKPQPQPRPSTKWSSFAASRGIKPRKRSRLVYDEGGDRYVSRAQARRARDAYPIIDARPGEAAGAPDPFKRRAEEKRERVAQNRVRQERNARYNELQGLRRARDAQRAASRGQAPRKHAKK